MSMSSEAAEQTVRIALEAGEMALKVSGSITEEIIRMLAKKLREEEKDTKKPVTELLRSGEDISVFRIGDSDEEKLLKETRRFGIPSGILRNEETEDALLLFSSGNEKKMRRILDSINMKDRDMVKSNGKNLLRSDGGSGSSPSLGTGDARESVRKKMGELGPLKIRKGKLKMKEDMGVSI
ncbi:MAG: DUF3801 domain-containing protein [Clostridia bacterium]|nr:DUF3801 domain-containing protein [Clostridia bacterium]